MQYLVLSIILVILGCIIDAIGWVVQRYDYLRQATNETNQVSFFKNKLWWTGFIMHSIGAAVSDAALGFSAQSLVVPLQTTKLLFSALLARFYLNEPFYYTHGIAISVMAVGIVSIVLCAPIQKHSYTTHELESMYAQPYFIYTVMISTTLIIMNYVSMKMNGTTTALVPCLMISSYFSTWNTLLTKSMLEIIVSTCKTKSAENFKHYATYLIIIGLILSMFFLEYWRQKALKNYQTVYVASVYQTMGMIGAVIFGVFYFNELSELTLNATCIFLGGIIFCMMGIMLLLYQQKDDQNTDEEWKEDKCIEFDLAVV